MSKEKKSPIDRTIYPLATMDIGEEFFFVPNSEPSFRAYVCHRAATLGRKFTVHKEARGGKVGLVVERVKA